MVTRLTSCRPVISTLTRPAPDWPSTSIAAIASCAFFMFSCIGLRLLHQTGELVLHHGRVPATIGLGLIESGLDRRVEAATARPARTDRRETRASVLACASARSRFSCAASVATRRRVDIEAQADAASQAPRSSAAFSLSA